MVEDPIEEHIRVSFLLTLVFNIELQRNACKGYRFVYYELLHCGYLVSSESEKVVIILFEI